jgi:hypothetical protein
MQSASLSRQNKSETRIRQVSRTNSIAPAENTFANTIESSVYRLPMPTFRRIQRCRICGNSELVPIIDLGDQYLTGIFPRDPRQALTHGPLNLVMCFGGAESCGLVQLEHSYDPTEMYGRNYGYRSALNRSMVDHLRRKAQSLSAQVELRDGDVVLDIGSNDGTFLSFFPKSIRRVGMDPSAAELCASYDQGIDCITDYFSANRFRQELGKTKARLVTSIAMFYDLDNPQEFVSDIASILADDGVWHFEQSYLPLMLDVNGYDTICHEHVEYYSLAQIEWMLTRAGLRVLDVETNSVNGGSFAVTAGKATGPPATNPRVAEMHDRERRARLNTLEPFRVFEGRVQSHRTQLTDLITQLTNDGSTILGYGASTKGNVILQYCGLSTEQIPCIAEVNTDKFGCFTPGTLIPIVSEHEAHAMRPDYFLAMPWHFRATLLEREAQFLARGGGMMFPLPELEIVKRKTH